MRKLLGLFNILLGVGIMIGAVVGQVLWLGFCFGTVIVGIILLFTMPAVLVWPAVVGVPVGFAFFINGLGMLMEAIQDDKTTKTSRVIDVTTIKEVKTVKPEQIDDYTTRMAKLRIQNSLRNEK